MRDLQVLAGASTPAYFTVWNRGGGTLVANRHNSDSGSNVDRDRPVDVGLLQRDTGSAGARLELARFSCRA